MSVLFNSEVYLQAVMPVTDPHAFTIVRSAIETSFSSAGVAAFLKSLERVKLRIRDFEVVLGKGMLGATVRSEYARLCHADQGMIRELYLSDLERVAPELRQKFFKLYAYY